VLQDLLNNIGILSRCNDPNGATALFTLRYVNGEHTPEPLSPGHRVGFWLWFLLFFDRFLGNDILPQFAVGRKHAMESGQIYPLPGYQRNQASHEFHWAEHYMGGSVVVRRFQGDDDVAVVGQGQSSFHNRSPSDIPT